ncbi:MAG TPA: SPW repeat protein [Stellaceae bacterium]|nr:SPW repeat protein [Stellaceae bacterium]
MAAYYNSSLVAQRMSNRVQDWVLMVLGIWFFISPWVLQFGSGVHTTGVAEPVGMVSSAAWNAWVMAALVFLVAISAIARVELWQEWLELIFGAWIIAAPWALGFTPLGAATWDHWGVGAVVFLIALWELWATPKVVQTTTMTTSLRPPPPGDPLP